MNRHSVYPSSKDWAKDIVGGLVDAGVWFEVSPYPSDPSTLQIKVKAEHANKLSALYRAGELIHGRYKVSQ